MLGKRSWKIEGREGAELFWEQELPGSLGEKRIIELLQRLASRHLTEDEIVSCSLPQKSSCYRPLLEPQIDAKGRGPICVGGNPFYFATFV